MVTVAKLASTLMNMIAEHPDVANMTINVELAPGKEYLDIAGIETIYRCKLGENGKIDMKLGLTIKLNF